MGDPDPEAMPSTFFNGWGAPSVKASPSFATQSEAISNPLNPSVVEPGRSLSEPATCLRDVIARNRSFYRFACLTGIIKPVASDNTGGCTNLNIRFRCWVGFLHTFFGIQCLLLVAYAGLELTNYGSRTYEVIIVSETIGLLIQNALLVPSVVYLRRELSASRDINLDQYNTAFQHAMKRGQIMFLILSFLLLVFLLFIGIGVGGQWGVIAAFIIFVCFLPSNCFLTGVFTFLVLEQRLSFFAMQEAEKLVVARDMTRDQYFRIQESIDYRDRLSPTNWLLFAAVLNTLVAVIIIVATHEAEAWNQLEMLGAVVLVLSVFGRQIVVLLMYLYQMTHVNAIADDMLIHLAKTDWEEKNMVRFDVYMLMKEFPMGSSLFFYRPSRLALMVEICSACVGLFIAVFWAFLFA